MYSTQFVQTLDTPSRLKGIETLDTPSRLKGIETFVTHGHGELLKYPLEVRIASSTFGYAFPFEGNWNSAPPCPPASRGVFRSSDDL